MLISSPEQMHEFWKSLALKNKVLLLKWDLWAGKTTLIKWFAEWLWIDPEKVQSPTYAYVNIYDDKLLHIDMYRLSTWMFWLRVIWWICWITYWFYLNSWQMEFFNWIAVICSLTMIILIKKYSKKSNQKKKK